jgi:hypothetical protein
MNDTISNNYARYPAYSASTQARDDKGSRRAEKDGQARFDQDTSTEHSMHLREGAEVTPHVDTDRAGRPDADSPLAALGAYDQAPVGVGQTQAAAAVDAVDAKPADLDAVRDALTQLLNDPEQFNRILASVLDDTQHA